MKSCIYRDNNNDDNRKINKIQQNIIITILLSFYIILASIIIFNTLGEAINAYAIEQYSFVNKWGSHGDDGNGQF